ncbi:YheC/YheD family protein [Natronincola ferrireducens]|uniref:YheC/D like ATP-grasp n=1 Tax=Natronincola ferrireducens TaxID=393762 RepID=A0A1G9EA86_9FIRM|nr:YheC/YheD family protein [Natronincola ferrireducens]SDK73080.1 hypothetical protein SAMN05660472_01889 [Natronincola ferrireducens]
MEDNVFNKLERLKDNSTQINTSLLYEEELLKEISLDRNITSLFKEKLEMIERFNNEVRVARREIHKNILNIKRQYIEETSVELGVLYGVKEKKSLFKILQIFKTIAEEYKVNIICFRLSDIDIENHLVKGIFISSKDIKDTISKIPPLIYNMGYYTKSSNIKKMKQLRRGKNINVINPINRFNQYIIFDIISALYKETSVLLPYTMFSQPNLYNYLEKYNSIYLFPEKMIDRRKTIIIQKKQHGYSVVIGANKKIFIAKNLYEYVLKVIQNKKYFIMKAPKAIKIKNTPLETRVYVQKNKNGNWEVTEMLAKCQWFYEDSIYQDVSYQLDEVLSMLIPQKSKEVENNLKEDALNISSYLEFYLNNIGSCILDFIITEEGHNHLIYFGGWEDKDFMLKLENKSSWGRYFKNAIDYLIHLRNSKVIYDGE